jgi:hypothetical protein
MRLGVHVWSDRADCATMAAWIHQKLVADAGLQSNGNDWWRVFTEAD